MNKTLEKDLLAYASLYFISYVLLFLLRGIGEPKYMPVIEWASLNKILTDALTSYNELNAAMDLVTGHL